MFIAERLEERRLMSSTITAELGGDGTLTVKGTLDADTIDINESGGVVTVTADGNPENLIFFGAASAVRVDSQGGNDQISYFGDSLTATIYLKNGDDYLQIGMSGSATATVFGGNGDDIIVASGNVVVMPSNGTDTVVPG